MDTDASPLAGRCAIALATYDRQPAHGEVACRALVGKLACAPLADWLECAQTLVLRGDARATLAVLEAALQEHPTSSDLRVAMAGALLPNYDPDRAESLLRDVLYADPDHAAAGFLLARMLKGQGRMRAMAAVLQALFRHQRHDPELVIRAIELLDDGGRQEEAAELCERELDAGSDDPRLHAYAGMLLAQLGQFERARTRHEFALAKTPQALEWHVPLGLSDLQRYTTRDHPDFKVFQACVQRAGLSDRARASLLFALGKAHDDIADYALAAHYLRDANATVHATIRWSRKQWRRGIEARISRRLPSTSLAAPTDWTPIFIVGMPRSGTTLLAELLARHPQVCHRGELAWLPTLAEQLAEHGSDDRRRLEGAAATYTAQLRQDDSDACWYIDKQPLNFLHVDLILALFPNARIIHCVRNARDNALSLWMQSFQPGRQEFAYDFADIGAAIHGSRRLMTHWMKRYPDAIRTVAYESVTAAAAGCLAELSTWLGLPPHDLLDSRSATTSISTASLWQARQPIHTRSVQRWRHYVDHLPELLQIPEN